MVRKFCVCVDLGHLSTYVPEKLHQYRVRKVWTARKVPVTRAPVGVGRVWQARERALEVEKKDAMPFCVETGDPPARPGSTSSRGSRRRRSSRFLYNEDYSVHVHVIAVRCKSILPFSMVRAPNRALVFTGSHFMSLTVFFIA